MKTIYTVYQLNEKRNKFGNPYIGFTENLIVRTKQWKRKLKLDYIPKLIPLYFSTEENQAFDWEQDKRVKNRWKREPPLKHLRETTKKANESIRTKDAARKMGQKYGSIIGKKNAESGHLDSIRHLGVETNKKNSTGVFNYESRSKGAKNNNAQKIKCLYCDFTSNPGNVGLHMKMYCKLKQLQ
jgi:hypothetical protein